MKIELLLIYYERVVTKNVPIRYIYGHASISGGIDPNLFNKHLFTSNNLNEHNVIQSNIIQDDKAYFKYSKVI